MSEKTMCPACKSITSAIYDAFYEGLPCPSCGLPADVAEAVTEAQARHADERLVERAVAAEKRAVDMEIELRRLRSRLGRIQHLVAAELRDEDFGW